MRVVWCSSRINRSLGFGSDSPDSRSKLRQFTSPKFKGKDQRGVQSNLNCKTHSFLLIPKHKCNDKGIIIVHVLPRILLAKHIKPPMPNSKIPQIKWRRKTPRTHPTHVTNVTWDDFHKTKGIIIIIGHVNFRIPEAHQTLKGEKSNRQYVMTTKVLEITHPRTCSEPLKTKMQVQLLTHILT